MQDRPEGYLLLSSTASKLSEVHPVFLGRSVRRIPLSMFRPGTSSTNFFNTTENRNSNSKQNQHPNHRQPRRYTLDEPNKRRPEHSKGHIGFSLTEIEVHNKSEEISTVGNLKN